MPAYTWASATSGLWGTGSLWTPNGVPGTSGGDTALINATGATYIITYDQPSFSLNNLTLNSATATLSFAGSTSLTVFGSTYVQAGTIELLNSGATLSAGSLTIDSGAQLRVGAGASVSYNTVTISGTVTLSGAVSFGTNAYSMNLGGLIEVTSGSATIGFSNIAGTGSIEADGAEVLVTGSMANAAARAVITSSASSVFKTTGALWYGSSMFVDFLGAAGEFEYDNPSSNQHITFNITGLNAGESAVTPTNVVNMAGIVVTVAGGGSGIGGTGSVTLSNGNVLSLSGITNGALGWQAQTASDGAGGTNIFLQSVCYAAGTHILTPDGERTIESLAPGDIVLTISGNDLVPRPIKWVGTRRIKPKAHPRPDLVAPILIRKDAFADGMPHRDLYVSPAHAVLVDGQLVCARLLANGATILQDTGRASVHYFHIELDSHAILSAEGLPAESYLDTGNRGFFANGGAAFVLHPDLTDPSDCPARETASCRPFIWREQDVRPVWTKLADRARALGRDLPRPRTTADAEPRIEANGRLLSPVCVDAGQYTFVLPGNVRQLRLVSRTSRPCDLKPWLEDSRVLGMMVRRIRFEHGETVIDLPLDHPGLSLGWWDIERDNRAMWRWTDGAAQIDVPAGATLLRIAAAPMSAYLLGGDTTASGVRRAA